MTKLLMIGALLLLAPQQTEPRWTVVFRFAEDNPTMPDARIYVVVRARQEGEAAIKANKYLFDKLSVAAAEKIIYVEAQKREDGK